jgi:hypothetical protein
MGETNPEQLIQDVELQTALNESAEAVSSYSGDEVQKRSTELAVREHFSGLESAETVRRANALYREFVEERGYDPHPTLVAAVGNAMVYFPEAETTGVILFKELFDAGDLGVNESPAKEDLDSIGHYLIEGDRFSLSETDVREVADALGIPKMIRGLELIRTLAGKMEDGEITAKLLFDLGIIDSRAYEQARAAEDNEDSELEDEDDFDYSSDEEAEDVGDVDIFWD